MLLGVAGSEALDMAFDLDFDSVLSSVTSFFLTSSSSLGMVLFFLSTSFWGFFPGSLCLDSVMLLDSRLDVESSRELLEELELDFASLLFSSYFFFGIFCYFLIIISDQQKLL